MLSWFTERASPPKQSPQAQSPGRNGPASKTEEEMGLSSYRLDQGIEVQELSMEEFLRVYKQG